MQTDPTTLQDLSINSTGANAVFEKLCLTVTVKGKQQLQYDFTHPPSSAAKIKEIQQTIIYLIENSKTWDTYISNGTLMVIERFLETTVNPLPQQPNTYTSLLYKLFSSSDFSLTKYSIKHCFDFLKGMENLVTKLWQPQCPTLLKEILTSAQKLLHQEEFSFIKNFKNAEDLSPKKILRLAYYLKHRYKRPLLNLIDLYARIDAWYGMGKAVTTYQLCFPEVEEAEYPFIEIKGLYHILLSEPVAYEVNLNPKQNFLFLTGANMAGKSTFIKATGIALFLAHAGMGVPAQKMRMSTMHGMLSNINVIDNIAKGESYFYNEVKRIKATIQQISHNQKWLILIDELFKGTNVQDAMKCSSTVIEGLVKVEKSLFILSTHLYEIADDLKRFPNIQFHYFETEVIQEQLHFTYQLKPGISHDRLGYLIMKKENVVALLNQL